MGWHLPVVLVSPLMLGLLALVASISWPRRAIVWSLLLPAWVLAAFGLRLLTARQELRGPVQLWCRVDAPGLWLMACALPLSALLLHWGRGTPEADRLRTPLWRFAAFQALVAGIGILPLPLLAVVVGLSGPHTWRARGVRYAVGAGVVAAFLCWPWPGIVDAVSAGTLGTCAGMLRPDSRVRRILIGTSVILALLGTARVLTHLP